MKISDLLGHPAIDYYRELTRIADTLRPMTELMSSPAALTLETESLRLGKSLTAPLGPLVEIDQFTSSEVVLDSWTTEALAATALHPSQDLSRISQLNEVSSLTIGFGDQQRIQDALASFSAQSSRIETARIADALRPMTELMAGSAALALETETFRLDKSLTAPLGPLVEIDQFTSSDVVLGSWNKEALAASALHPSHDLPGIAQLNEVSSLARGFGDQWGIQDALASFNLQSQIEAAVQEAGQITAGSAFRDLDRFASIGGSVLQRYVGRSAVFDIPFDESLLQAAGESIVAVQAELALDRPLTEVSLLEAIEAGLQRVQALTDSPALKRAVLGILTLILGSLISAEWTLYRTNDERLRTAEKQHTEIRHEEAQTRLLRGLSEQWRTVTNATELHAVITHSAHLRARPDSVSSSYTLLPPGETVLIREQENGWLHVTAHVPERGLVMGWVYAKRAKAVLE